MNYQIFPLFFTRVGTLLFFLIAVGLLFFGVSALISYFILVGIVFPVLISMRLHRLNESGLTFVLTETSQWMIYIHGFPAQEQRAVLKNPCFFSPQRLRQFFIAGFSGKLCIQIGCFIILAYDYANDGDAIATLVALVCLLLLTGNCVRSLYRVITNQWRCEDLTTDTGTVWYQGFIHNGGLKVTLLKQLC